MEYRLVLIEVTLMRMLQTVLGHQGSCLNTVGDEVLAEVQDALRQLRSPLVAILIAVA